MTGSYTGEARDPKHLKEPKHSTTVKNQKTSQQYCTVLLLVFVLLLVLLDFYSRISGMSSVDTWPKAVQNWLKAAHISPRFPGRLAFGLAGTRFKGFVASVVLVPSGTTPHTRESREQSSPTNRPPPHNFQPRYPLNPPQSSPTGSPRPMNFFGEIKPSDCPCEATGTRDTARLEPTWVEDSQVLRTSYSRLAAN